MIPCSCCQRHIRAADTTCPFCGTRADLLPAGVRRAFNLAMAAATPVFLAACYGGAPDIKPCETGVDCMDADDDGFVAAEDCDDTNADVNPNALEVCDDEIDNDCDGAFDDKDEDCATT